LFTSKLFILVPKDLLIDIKSSINIDIMNFLSIDCSTDLGSLFIKAENKTFNKILQSDKYSNDLLMKQILDFFIENNLTFSNISAILVNQGPGSFSAIRTSIAVAKGLSITNKLSLYGFNSYDLKDMNYMNIILLYQKGHLTKKLIKPLYLS